MCKTYKHNVDFVFRLKMYLAMGCNAVGYVTTTDNNKSAMTRKQTSPIDAVKRIKDSAIEMLQNADIFRLHMSL